MYRRVYLSTRCPSLAKGLEQLKYFTPMDASLGLPTRDCSYFFFYTECMAQQQCYFYTVICNLHLEVLVCYTSCTQCTECATALAIHCTTAHSPPRNSSRNIISLSKLWLLQVGERHYRPINAKIHKFTYSIPQPYVLQQMNSQMTSRVRKSGSKSSTSSIHILTFISYLLSAFKFYFPIIYYEGTYSLTI